MISSKILGTEDYLRLSKGARCLYIQLCLAADDDGMISNVKPIMRFCEATEEEHQELISTGYLLGVIGNIECITHWHIHNSIPKNRYTKSTVDWKYFLELEDGVYKIKERRI